MIYHEGTNRKTGHAATPAGLELVANNRHTNNHQTNIPHLDTFRPRKRTYRALRARLTATGTTLQNIADAIGRSETYVTNRMNASCQWQLDDIYKIMTYLDLPDTAIAQYFPQDPFVEIEHIAG